MNWSDQTKRGQDFTRTGKQSAEGVKPPGNNSPRRWADREVQRLCDGVKVPSEEGRRTDIGKCARFTSRDCGNEGVKGFTPNGQPLGKNELGRKYGSKSRKRKEASAIIAKIPRALADWIAKVFKPNNFAAEKTNPVGNIYDDR